MATKGSPEHGERGETTGEASDRRGGLTFRQVIEFWQVLSGERKLDHGREVDINHGVWWVWSGVLLFFVLCSNGWKLLCFSHRPSEHLQVWKFDIQRTNCTERRHGTRGTGWKQVQL